MPAPGPAADGKGADTDPLDLAGGALERGELLRTLGCAVVVLLRESDEVYDLAARVVPDVRELARQLASRRPARRTPVPFSR